MSRNVLSTTDNRSLIKIQNNTQTFVKILIGINLRAHVLLSNDELKGLNDIGFQCRSTRYGRNDFSKTGTLARLLDVVKNAFAIIVALYKFSPAILYVNSRFDRIACTRDLITIFLIKCFYFKKIKIVIKAHGSELSVLTKKSFFYRQILIPYLSKHVDAWFFLSQEEKAMISQYNPGIAKKIFITSNIINPARFISSMKFRKKYQLDKDKDKILFIGRVTHEKGVFEVLNAIPLTNCKDQCDFIFVGDGPDLKKLKELATKLNISSHTKFLGWLDEEEADNFYANCDMLVFPTYFDEGFPMALFKSVAAGLPVITTRTRAAIDHLKMPDNVLWVDAKSENQVAKAINELRGNDALRISMRQNNKLLGTQFSQDKICEEMGKVFMSL